MRRLLLSIIMVVIGLSAFSQSPSRLVCLQPAYPLSVGQSTAGGVELSSNGLCLQDTPLDSLPHYEIGEIGTQTVRYITDSHGFYVKADSLHSLNVTYSIEVTEPPTGTIEFNETTGRFKFFPTEDDYKSFVVTFTATNGKESLSEDVVFDLMPQLPSETDAFHSTGVMPDAGDYTVVAETSTIMFLNNQNRTAYSVSISGKDVVFDNALQNKVWGLNGREDIYELNIYAERLIIRSALTFPQTNITIYAKEFIFEDKGSDVASICTTPSKIEMLADGEGLNGADAGNITLNIKSFKGNMAKRLILCGANGQNTNRNGTPGNGGNSGTVRSTVDVSNYCDFARGCGGVKYDVDSGASDYLGSAIGYGENGSSGSIKFVNRPHAYLHPYYLSAVIRHANDAFINNQTEYVLQTCKEYRLLINECLEAPKANDGLDDDGMLDYDLELQSELTELGSMLFNIEQGLDYFGNPTGWVPLLSFEVMLANYNNEIDRAIPTLYMYYWLNRIDQTLQHKIEASRFAASTTEQEIDNNLAILNALIGEVPVLQDEAEEISNSIAELTVRLEKLQEELLRKAKHNVKKRNRYKRIIGIVKTVANVLPITGAIGTAIGTGLNVALQVANSFSDFAGYGDFSDVYSKINNSGCDQTFFNDVSTAMGNIKTGVATNNYNQIVNAGQSLAKSIKPLAENLGYLQNTLSKSSAPNDEVQAEYNRLMASSPIWNAIKGEIDVLNDRKEKLLNHMNDVFGNMTTTVSEINSDALALDAFRRDVFIGNSKRDLNAMLYLAKMEQRAKSRLLLYDYYMRKAYEYRLLKPYEGEDYNLVGMFERFQSIAQAGDSVIDTNAYNTLATIFRERISDMTEKIVAEYSKGNEEQSASITIAIPKEQLDIINDGESVTLNFHDMGVFSPEEENVRIIGLNVEYLDKHVDGNIGYSGRMDIQLTHSGISQFRKDGNLYWFNHMSHTSENHHTWGMRYDAKTQKITNIQPSAASSSLLYSLLKSNSDEIMLFSRPSAWSDITVSKSVQTPGGADILIDSLMITLQYDFTYRPSNIRNIEVSANENLMPYFACSEEDLNGRSSGNGKLCRSFRNSSQSVTFTAINKYETYYFKNWTDQSGRIVSDKADLTVKKSTDQFYIANYERRVPILGVADTVFVGNDGGTYTVNVNNIGTGDTKMDWYVEDSLSTFTRLNGVTEGIDDGTFTFICEANTTGKERVDSLEIFAPETDAMSKTIYIVQTNVLRGDVNLDGAVDVADISAIIRVMANGADGDVNAHIADVNGDGVIDVADISAIIIIMAARARMQNVAEE